MNILDFRNQRATVMGLGLFGGGISVTRYLAQYGMRVTVTDLRTPETLRESIESLKGLPVEFHLGEHREEDFAKTDLVIANPAVRQDSPYLQIARANGIPIVSELDLFLDACPAPTVAVTGSNGKSTTTALCGEILEKSKLFRKVWVGGNIGRSLLDWVREIQFQDVVVLEVSSFQLEALQPKREWPKVAVVLRITPDHLDRHGNFENYVNAKSRILEFQGNDGTAILNADDPIGVNWKSRCKGKTVVYGNANSELRVQDGAVVFLNKNNEAQKIISIYEVRLPGSFNLENVMAASGAALTLGVSPETIRDAVAGFPGVEHRLEYLGERQNIRIYNNAVSTAPESTLSALQALPAPIVLVAGGKGKNLDLKPLASEIANRTRLCVFYGDAAKALAQEVIAAGNKNCTVVETLPQALDYILPKLWKNDNLLYSPAFSSYDQYRNFTERGEVFRKRLDTWLSAHPKSRKNPSAYKSFSNSY